MVDHHYRCIFIHQRKAAGASIIAAFAREHADIDRRRYNSGVAGSDWARRTAPEESYFVFSVVRNPFDRLISAWKYLPSLRELPLESVLRQLPREGHDYRHITRRQVDLLLPPGSRRLVVHDLIRFESLQADFERVCRTLGKRDASLKWLHRGDRTPDYRPYFSPLARTLAEEAFRPDLDFFGYSF